jgi:hypothetical protein
MQTYSNEQPDVNNPNIRMSMIMKKISGLESKIKEIAEQKRLMELGVPSAEYNSMEELKVDIEFQIVELNKLLLEVRFISYTVRYDMPYSLN